MSGAPGLVGPALRAPAQDTLIVPLPHGLSAVYVLRPKPKPTTPPYALAEQLVIEPPREDDGCPF